MASECVAQRLPLWLARGTQQCDVLGLSMVRGLALPCVARLHKAASHAACSVLTIQLSALRDEAAVYLGVQIPLRGSAFPYGLFPGVALQIRRQFHAQSVRNSVHTIFHAAYMVSYSRWLWVETRGAASPLCPPPRNGPDPRVCSAEPGPLGLGKWSEVAGGAVPPGSLLCSCPEHGPSDKSDRSGRGRAPVSGGFSSSPHHRRHLSCLVSFRPSPRRPFGLVVELPVRTCTSRVGAPGTESRLCF